MGNYNRPSYGPQNQNVWSHGQHPYAPYVSNAMASGYGHGRNNRMEQIKKHSGAKHRTYSPKTGDNAGQTQYLTTAWKLNRNKELISVKCVTTSKSVESDKGWFGSVACSFTNTVTGETHFKWGTMQKSTGKVVIDKIAFVVNPRANNGGYCGTYLKRK